MSAYVYDFAHGSRDMRDLLGGKGANLAEMTRIGLPVPDGFIVTTEACRAYLRDGERWPDGLHEEVSEHLAALEERIGKRLGAADDPLLVSVRSGAPVSMPGMMDTILNLGLNAESVRGLAAAAGDGRFAADSYRRFVQMYGNVVMGVRADVFEEALARAKRARGVDEDVDLDEAALQELVKEFLGICRDETGEEFPEDPRDQLDRAITAVFASWNTPRARTYRRHEGIPDDLGTAVNVVQMVFGNLGADSATGVAFTRNPSTGERALFGEFLVNAQGEDVVAGIRTPRPIVEMEHELAGAYAELHDGMERLESHYRDMQDVEFTVERGRLYILQTRTGKRTAQAAVRVARELVAEGVIDREEAVRRIDAAQLDQLMHPAIDPDADFEVLAQGLNASPGAAVGSAVFDADTAESRGRRGRRRPGARVRRRGDRPLPHRAYVFRRRAAAGDAGDDPGPRRGRSPVGAGSAAAVPAIGLRGDPRGHGGPGRDDPAARPAAPRVPARPRKGGGGGRAAPGAGEGPPRG